MKTAFVTSLLALLYHFSFGQINAGDVPVGATLESYTYSFSLPQDNMADTAMLDLNCDNVADIHLVLASGYPAVDAPRFVSAEVVNPNYSVCATGSGQTQAQFYLQNDPLTCSGIAFWDSVHPILSVWGGWVPIGPFSMSDVYISYENGGNQGWIKLSYDLSALPITLEVAEAIVYCGTNSIEDLDTQLNAALFPNPNTDGILQIQSDEQFAGYEIVNTIGQIIEQFEGTFTQIELPSSSGIYIVRITGQNGKTTQHKIIRR